MKNSIEKFLKNNLRQMKMELQHTETYWIQQKQF